MRSSILSLLAAVGFVVAAGPIPSGLGHDTLLPSASGLPLAQPIPEPFPPVPEPPAPIPAPVDPVPVPPAPVPPTPVSSVVLPSASESL